MSEVSGASHSAPITLDPSPVTVGVSLDRVVLVVGEERVGLAVEDAVRFALMILNAAQQLRDADSITGRRQ
jgi:hypothetical protein